MGVVAAAGVCGLNAAAPAVWGGGAGAAHAAVAVAAGALAAGLFWLWAVGGRPARDARPGPGGVAAAGVAVAVALGVGGAARAADPPAGPGAAGRARAEALAEALLDLPYPRRPDRARELVALGPAAVPAMVDVLRADRLRDDRLIDLAIDGWPAGRALDDPGARAAALGLVPDVVAQVQGMRAMRFLGMFEVTRRTPAAERAALAAAYARRAVTADADVRAEAARRMIEIDGGAAMVAAARDRLARRVSRAEVGDTFMVLRLLGPAAHGLLIDLTRSADDDVVSLAVDALSPKSPLDTGRSDGRADERHRPGTARIERAADPDLAPAVIARLDEIVRERWRSGDRGMVNYAAYALAHGGPAGRARLFALLSDPDPGPAAGVMRQEVTQVLGERFPALWGLADERTETWIDKPGALARWAAIARAARLVTADPERAAAGLMEMVGADDRAEREVAAAVLTNVGVPDGGELGPMVAAFRKGGRARELLAGAVFAGESGGSPEVRAAGVEAVVGGPAGAGGEAAYERVLRTMAEAGPGGPRALAAALADPRAGGPAARRALGFLTSHEAAAGIARAGARLDDPRFRAAAGRLIEAYLEGPVAAALAAHVAGLDAPDPSSSAAAAWGFRQAGEFGGLGPVTGRKVEALLAAGAGAPPFPVSYGAPGVGRPRGAARPGPTTAPSVRGPGGAPAGVWVATAAGLGVAALAGLGLLLTAAVARRPAAGAPAAG